MDIKDLKYSKSNSKKLTYAAIGLVLVGLLGFYLFRARVVDSKTSKLYFYYAGEIYNIKTNQKEVLGAVSEAGVSLDSIDQLSIPKDTVLSGQSLVFSIQKAWPVAIYDDNKLIIGKTTSTDPKTILEQNGIKLWPEDNVFDELNLTPNETNSAGQIIRIKRAPVYKILVDDGTIEVRSWGGTIKEVIEGRVILGPRDIVEPSLEATAVPQDIIVTRINVVETEDEVLVPYKTTYQDDYFVAQGVEQKTVAGQNGVKKRQLKITYRNGVEVSRVILSETITSSPITEIIKRGQMPSNHPDFNRTYWNIMVSAGLRYGISPLSLFKVAACESHVNPNSVGGGGQYLGMYQYTSGFWSQASSAAGYGGVAWNDATAQIYSTANWASKYGWGRWGCSP